VSVAIPPEGADRARWFYGEVLGLEERDVLPKLDPGGFIWFRVGGDLELHLMLMDEEPADKPHFCLVVDDLDGVRRRIEGAGIETRDPTPLEGRPRFTCRDPFGNMVELARLELPA
jgi:catechol 2,3-dioxygenase-like lactoylglutathione lyase family enzyme